MKLSFTLAEFVNAGMIGWVMAFFSGLVFGVIIGWNLTELLSSKLKNPNSTQ